MRYVLMVFWAALLLFPATVIGSETGKGKLGVATDIEDALIYVNDRKKATAGEDYTEILLKEGEYEIRVEKVSADGQWVHKGGKRVFVGADTFVKIRIKTEKYFRLDDTSAGPAAPLLSPAGPVTVSVASRPQSAKIFVEAHVPGLKFVLIQPGRFLMGSPAGEKVREKDEVQHQVAITQAFYMQTTEVTQGQWKRVTGENPSLFKDCGDTCPVENVSWHDVQRFIKQLNRMAGKDVYRLPTEAEWEYACRAGSESIYSVGECLSSSQANFDARYNIPGCTKGDFTGKPLHVAAFGANPWGLYDMHGNVWEWCADWKGAYNLSASTDPAGSAKDKHKVVRGGSWFNTGRDCRSANRGGGEPDYRNGNLGFRLVRIP